MSDFKSKMHQIVCRLGLGPRLRWGSLQRSPRLPSWILGGLLLRGGERREGKGKEGKGREREGRKEGGEGWEGRGQCRPPKLKLGPPELFSWRRRCISIYRIVSHRPWSRHCKTKIKTKSGAVLNHSPANACRIRQCDKLQQVVQFKACVTITACAYSSTAVNVSS